MWKKNHFPLYPDFIFWSRFLAWRFCSCLSLTQRNALPVLSRRVPDLCEHRWEDLFSVAEGSQYFFLLLYMHSFFSLHKNAAPPCDTECSNEFAATWRCSETNMLFVYSYIMTNSTKGACCIKKSIACESDAASKMTQTRACLPTLASSAKTKRYLTGREKKQGGKMLRATPGSETSFVSDSCARTQVSLVLLYITPSSIKTARAKCIV